MTSTDSSANVVSRMFARLKVMLPGNTSDGAAAGTMGPRQSAKDAGKALGATEQAVRELWMDTARRARLITLSLMSMPTTVRAFKSRAKQTSI
jgi:hypothetical protein